MGGMEPYLIKALAQHASFDNTGKHVPSCLSFLPSVELHLHTGMQSHPIVEAGSALPLENCQTVRDDVTVNAMTSV